MKSIQAAAAGSNVSRSFSNGTQMRVSMCTSGDLTVETSSLGAVIVHKAPAMDERALSGLQERMAKLKGGVLDKGSNML